MVASSASGSQVAFTYSLADELADDDWREFVGILGPLAASSGEPLQPGWSPRDIEELVNVLRAPSHRSPEPRYANREVLREPQRPAAALGGMSDRSGRSVGRRILDDQRHFERPAPQVTRLPQIDCRSGDATVANGISGTQARQLESLCEHPSSGVLEPLVSQAAGLPSGFDVERLHLAVRHAEMVKPHSPACGDSYLTMYTVSSCGPNGELKTSTPLTLLVSAVRKGGVTV